MIDDKTPLTYDPLEGQIEHTFSAREVSARQTMEALLNIYNLASTHAPPGSVQPFDAFALGALTAYLSEQEQGDVYDQWFRRKL